MMPTDQCTEERRAALARVRLCNLLLMGEAPGNYPKYDPARHALFPHPPRSAGARLRLLMGMSLSEYVALERRNLLDSYPGKQGKGARFPKTAAREAVAMVRRSHLFFGRNVLFVGRRVAGAFGHGDDEILSWHHRKAYNWAVVPHTSGINRWWNDPDNLKVGREFLVCVAEQARNGSMSFD